MDYSKICKVYGRLEGTSKGLEKTEILAGFLGDIHDNPEFIYLLRGKLFADYESKEIGISHQLVIKAISRAAGISEDIIVEDFRKLGELGLVAEKVLGEGKKQKGLFEKKLSVEKVMENLRKLPEIEGSGTVDLKIGYIVDLLHSATAEEAKYVIRSVLGDLKIGVGVGILRDAIAVHCFNPKDLEDKKACVVAVQEAYDKATDFREVFERACNDSLEKIKLLPGKPLKVMLFPKAKDIEDAFRIVGRPAAFEYKYDGFRVMVNKSEDGGIKIFTRALENVTRQFPEIVEYVESNVSGETFILDCEAVGFDAKKNEYTDFQAISQRIRRKYGISEMRKELPVELVVFDVVFLDGESLIDVGFGKRRKMLEGIIKVEDKKIVLAKRIVSSDNDEVEKFYDEALEDNQEGLMGKRLDAPYKPGARIGYAVKLKPEDRDFDLVITGAEWGTGKRAGWLTSFDIACRNTSGFRGFGVSGFRKDLGNVVIVHGSNPKDQEKVARGFPEQNEQNWIPWTKKELEKKGFIVENPLMPRNWNPDYNEWKNEFENIKIDENSILVGTSAGGGFLVRWLGETNRKIRKLVLIAPAIIHSGEWESLDNLLKFKIDKSIINNIEEIVLIKSSNDSEGIKESCRLYSKVLGIKPVVLENRGHFVQKSVDEVMEFPELIDEIAGKEEQDIGSGELLEVGRVSTGLKELKDEGLSFGEMTDMLEKLVLKVDGRHVFVKPEIVVSVQFQNVQRSPTNSSGFALRFPRILRLRPDRGAGDVATVEDIEKEVE